MMVLIAALAMLGVVLAVWFATWHDERAYKRLLDEDRAFWADVHRGRADAVRLAFTLPDGPLRDGMLEGVAESIELERKVKDNTDE